MVCRFVGSKVARCALVTNAWLERLVLVGVLSFVLRLLLVSFAWLRCVVSVVLVAGGCASHRAWFYPLGERRK